MMRRHFLTVPFALPAVAASQSFRAKVGVNIYTFRYRAEKDLTSTLALIRELGFREVECGNLYRHSPAEFLALLKSHGLRPTSMGAAYNALRDDLEGVVAKAKALGVKYVVCSTIPHTAKHLAEKDVPPAAESLNRWGQRLASSGVHLCYHTHGTEFDPSPDGTRFDTLAKLTDPRFVSYEMDIFWIVYGFQDPAQLLRRYPGRFPLMHVKDIRKGTVLGGSPADVREDESVALGAGIVDVRSALLAAQTYGVKHFYLEDEAVEPVEQIRQSLRYIAALR